MEKRYQVFISSTFTDLKEERQSVLRAILELDHMPAGMELFPAADDTAWQLIKDVIDVSDYYVLVIGGRYGSIDESGIGFTEKEYDYAVASKKPVIPFLHKNPDLLPREKTETNEAVWNKLNAFRKKVENRHTCVYWQNAEDLKAKVIVGLTSVGKRHPAIGWIRADQIPSDATLTELFRLQQRILELEADAETERTKPPVGTDNLSQGEDIFRVKVAFSSRINIEDIYHSDTPHVVAVEPTWNEIFAAVAPSMISEISERDMNRVLENFFIDFTKQLAIIQRELIGKELVNFRVENDVLDTCRVQFRALGLITESQRARSNKENRTYWKLTPYGDHLMVQLRAIQKVSITVEPTE